MSPDSIHRGSPAWVSNNKGKRHMAQTKHWEPLQSFLEILTGLFSVEAVVIDAQCICVAGTGPYKQGIGLEAPKDTRLAESIHSGVQTVMLRPREEGTCLHCSQNAQCKDQANYTAPLLLEGRIAGAVQIVTFDQGQRMALLECAEQAFMLVRQLVDLLHRTGALPLGTRTENAQARCSLDALVGHSQALATLKEHIIRVAPTAAPVLLFGESGTGKELAAQAIHNNSVCATGPFVPVNCGALPEALMESELFGYAAGAFSGANAAGKQGLWEQAAGGTLFLDEIGELPMQLQVKLLRTLQDGMVRKVGDAKLTHVPTRIIAATNKDLRYMVRQGTFREDLYFRLNVMPLYLAPLRERKEDIRPLIMHFITRECRTVGSRTLVVDPVLMAKFMEYHWPGNVRELKNFIEYGIAFSKNGRITWEDLAPRFETPYDLLPQEGTPVQAPQHQARSGITTSMVQAMLIKHGKSVPGKRTAAKELGISLATLYRIMAQK